MIDEQNPESVRGQEAIWSRSGKMANDSTNPITIQRHTRWAHSRVKYMARCAVTDVRIVGYPSDQFYKTLVHETCKHYHFSENILDAYGTVITS